MFRCVYPRSRDVLHDCLLTPNFCLYNYYRVIPRQHAQILELLRTIVLQLLFDSKHLENYIQERINKFSVEVNIVDCITQALNSRFSERIIDSHINRLYTQPEAAYLNAIGVSKGRLKPMIKPAVLSLCAESAPLVIGTATNRGNSELVSCCKHLVLQFFFEF